MSSTLFGIFVLGITFFGEAVFVDECAEFFNMSNSVFGLFVSDVCIFGVTVFVLVCVEFAAFFNMSNILFGAFVWSVCFFGGVVVIDVCVEFAAFFSVSNILFGAFVCIVCLFGGTAALLPLIASRLTLFEPAHVELGAFSVSPHPSLLVPCSISGTCMLESVSVSEPDSSITSSPLFARCCARCDRARDVSVVAGREL